MSIGDFVDGKRRPTGKEIESALGEKAELWNDLSRYIADEYSVRGEIAFAGAKYGWELGFRKGGRPLADLYPGTGRFTVQVVLGRAATEAAKQLPLGSNVKKVFDNARQLYDGRWLFIPVRTKRDVADIKRLIEAKVRSK